MVCKHLGLAGGGPGQEKGVPNQTSMRYHTLCSVLNSSLSRPLLGAWSCMVSRLCWLCPVRHIAWALGSVVSEPKLVQPAVQVSVGHASWDQRGQVASHELCHGMPLLGRTSKYLLYPIVI